MRSQKRGRAEDGEASRDSSALTALKQWASVPKKAREAMKRCTPEVVETLELPILEYLDKVIPLFSKLTTSMCFIVLFSFAMLKASLNAFFAPQYCLFLQTEELIV